MKSLIIILSTFLFSTSFAQDTGIKSIAETLSADTRFDTLVSLATDNGLVSALANEENQLTVFAPVNDAFNGLNTRFLSAITNKNKIQNKNALLYLLQSHVVPFAVSSSEEFLGQSSWTTLASAIQYEIRPFQSYFGIYGVKGPERLGLDPNRSTSINIAKVTEIIKAKNGYIFVIDKVIVPEKVLEKIALDVIKF